MTSPEELAALITAEVAGMHAQTAGAATAMGKHLAQALTPMFATSWDEAVEAAFQGAITRQNAADVKRRNPFRAAPEATCGRFVSWWDGEYEGTCELPAEHPPPHFDGVSYYDDEGEQVEPEGGEGR